MNKYTILEVAGTLLGKIHPIGDSQIDKERLDNLKNQIFITDCLIDDLFDLEENKSSHEHSVKLIGKEAYNYLKDLTERLNDYLDEN